MRAMLTWSLVLGLILLGAGCADRSAPPPAAEEPPPSATPSGGEEPAAPSVAEVLAGEVCGLIGPTFWINGGQTLMTTLEWGAPLGPYFLQIPALAGCQPATATWDGTTVALSYNDEMLIAESRSDQPTQVASYAVTYDVSGALEQVVIRAATEPVETFTLSASYDAQGRVIKVEIQRTDNFPEASGLQLSPGWAERLAAGPTSTTSYSYSDPTFPQLPTEIIDSQNGTLNLSYEAGPEGRVVKRVLSKQGGGQVTEVFHYEGPLLTAFDSTEDGSTSHTEFHYDEYNRLLAQVDGGTTTIEMKYAAEDRIAEASIRIFVMNHWTFGY